MSLYRESFWVKAELMAVAIGLLPVCSWSEAIVDASWGRTPQSLSGNFTIPEVLGKRSGNNLFHSFDKFNINTGESATFTTTTPSIANVISRVSGTETSSINGLLKLNAVSGSKPSFFFINPNGVTFGAGAYIDVPGSFHVSTADSLRFADGIVFRAGKGPDNTLTVAQPEAFGFLEYKTGSIILNGSKIKLTSKSKLDINAGDIEIRGTTLEVPDGSIRIVGVGNQAKQVKLNSSKVAGVDGSIRIADSILDVGGLLGGEIGLYAGDLKIRNSVLKNEVYKSKVCSYYFVTSCDFNPVILESNQKHSAFPQATTLEGNKIQIANTVISREIYGNGNVGDIFIKAADDVIFINTDITSKAENSSLYSTHKNATIGDINITGRTISFDTSNIWNLIVGNSQNVGSVNIIGQRIAMSNSLVNSIEVGNGIAPKINLFATETVKLFNSDVRSSARDHLADDRDFVSGNLTIKSPIITMDHSTFDTGLSQSFGTIGNIVIEASHKLEMNNQSRITASASAWRPPMSSSVIPGSITIESPILILNNESAIATQSSHASSSPISIISGRTANSSPLRILGDGTALIDLSTGVSEVGAPLTIAGRDVLIQGVNLLSINYAFFSRDGTEKKPVNEISIRADGQVTLIDTNIRTDSSSGINAGNININGTKIILDHAEITSSTENMGQRSQGNAGNIYLTSKKDILLKNGSKVSTDTNTVGSAGLVEIRGKALSMENSSITSVAHIDSNGQAGKVVVDVTDKLYLNKNSTISISNEATNAIVSNISPTNLVISSPLVILADNSEISSRSIGKANASNILIHSNNDASSLTILGDAKSKIDSSTFNSGHAGKIELYGHDIFIDEMSLTSTSGDISGGKQINGNAGSIALHAPGLIKLGQGTILSTDTYSTGNAGGIGFSANNIQLNNAKILSRVNDVSSIAHAGLINVKANDDISIINGSVISSNTSGKGNAGSIKINSQNLTIDDSGISSVAERGSLGNAGEIVIDVEKDIAMGNNSKISSDTFGKGAAGSINLNVGDLSMDLSEISSAVREGSSGQTGNIRINVQGKLTLAEKSRIDIQNDADVNHLNRLKPTDLTIKANDLELSNGAKITSASSGNADASHINIKVNNKLQMNDALITTAAQNGNGGNINVDIGNMARLKNSQMSTSVSGLSGNGGDINVISPILILEHGYIQANTEGKGASGGMVSIDSNALINSGRLIIGGATPIPFTVGSDINVIQAAARDGVSGEIRLVNPQTDISSSLTELDQTIIDTNAFANNICHAGKGSSFTQITRGNFFQTFMKTLSSQVNSGQRIKKVTFAK